LASAVSTPQTTTAFTRVQALFLVAAGVVGLGMLAGNAEQAPLTLGTVLQVLVGLSFVACGTFIWARRRVNRLGPLMMVVGFLWLLGRTMTLVAHPVVYIAGLWLTDLWAPAFALFLLSFPTGRLTSRLDLVVVGVFLFVTVPLEFVWFLFLVPANGMNALGVAADPSAAHVIDTIQRDVISLGAVLLVIAVGRHWGRSSHPVRRQMLPVVVGTIAILLQSVSWVFLSSGQSLEFLDDLIFVAQIAIPIAILAVMLRARMARASVADLVVELGQAPTPARLREALANALGDPSLQVAYWAPTKERFVDPAGELVPLPDEGSGQAVTLLERSGVPEAAIIHDAILLEEPGLISSVLGAMRLAVENDRLTSEVEAQLEEVRASRARIVAAGDAERQRLERDLHDGAQQRLVALTLALRLARQRLGDEADPSIKASLEQASEEAKAALSELRELARGIHPQILTEAGLHAAIESLAARSPAIVSVDIDPDARYAPAVEAIAYFVVSEALANIGKYAEAGTVQIRAGWRDGVLMVEVADDGRGGADPRAGTGLRGLVDRVSAVDGTLEVVSPLGGGTRIVARIPAAPPTHLGDRTTGSIET
jgi:signal transduction histidine kinase